MTVPVTVLVVAKAPVPGLAKTRLAHTLGAEGAADLAAAALLDTLDAVAATPTVARMVALTGDLASARGAAEASGAGAWVARCDADLVMLGARDPSPAPPPG